MFFVFFPIYEIYCQIVSIQHPVLIPKGALLNTHHPPSLPSHPPSTLSLFSVFIFLFILFILSFFQYMKFMVKWFAYNTQCSSQKVPSSIPITHPPLPPTPHQPSVCSQFLRVSYAFVLFHSKLFFSLPFPHGFLLSFSGST